MALPAVVSKIEEVPEAFRGEYKQITEGPHKGKFIADITSVDGFGLEDIKGLKATVSSTRSERDALAQKVSKLGTHTAEEIAEAIARLEEIKNFNPDEKSAAKIEAMKKQLAEKHATELTTLQKTLQDRDRELSEIMVDSAATAAIAKHKGNLTLLLPHVRAAIRVVRDKETGKVVRQIIDEKGNARVSMKQGNTDNMDVDEYVETLRGSKEFAPAFAGSGSSGAGAGTTPSGGTPSNNGGSGGAPGMSAVDALRATRRAQG